MPNEVGRPTEYNESVQAKADEYVFQWKEHGDAIPSIAGLCCYIGIARSTAYLWREEYAQFSDTLSKIEVLQERTALNHGLVGTFNSTITKLVLANHGYSDKVQTDHTSSDGSMSHKEVGGAVLDALTRKHADT